MCPKCNQNLFLHLHLTVQLLIKIVKCSECNRYGNTYFFTISFGIIISTMRSCCSKLSKMHFYLHKKCFCCVNCISLLCMLCEICLNFLEHSSVCTDTLWSLIVSPLCRLALRYEALCELLSACPLDGITEEITQLVTMDTNTEVCGEVSSQHKHTLTSTCFADWLKELMGLASLTEKCHIRGGFAFSFFTDQSQFNRDSFRPSLL